jgi:hypothetical protein
MPALSGLWASGASYPVEPQRHRRAARSTREMLLTNLCNRLVVTSTLGVTPSPSPGLSPSYPPRTSSSFCLGGSPAFCPRPSSATPDCHCWRLRPWVGHAVGTAPASCCQAITPEGMRGVPRRSPSGCCRPASSPMVWPADAPCRCPQPLPGIPSRAARARTRFPASHQRMRLFEPEAPSTSKSHRRRPGSRPNGDRMGRHWYLGFAAEGPASDMLSRSNPRSARPKGLPTVRRGPVATCRLPASAMECPPSTPTCRPIPKAGRGKPRPTR